MKTKEIGDLREAGTEVLAKPMYSAAAEKSVLAAMLARPHDVIDEVIPRLAVEDFFVPAHRTLYAVLLELHQARKAIDITTVHDALLSRGLVEKVGSPALLADMLASLATHLNAAGYVEIVREKAILRSLQSGCADITQFVYANMSDATACLDMAERTLHAITARTNAPVKRSVGQEAEATLKELAEARENKTKLGLPMPFYSMQKKCHGWQPGKLYVFAARPGVGKSAMMMTCARHLARSRYDKEKDGWVLPGHAAGIISLEMPQNEYVRRMLAMETGKEMSVFSDPQLFSAEVERLAWSKVDDIKRLPLAINDRPGLTIEQIRSQARRWHAGKDGMTSPLEWLAVDYLSLVKPSGTEQQRYLQVAEVSKGLKELAKELHIPVLALAQLSRQAEIAGEPSLRHLRESGDIEQDADAIAFLWPESIPDNAPQPPAWMTPMQMMWKKNRGGECFTESVIFNMPSSIFEDRYAQVPEARRKETPTESDYDNGQ